MMKIILLVTLLASSSGCGLSNALYWADPAASHAIVNAKVLTMNDAQPHATAILMAEDKIIAVGTDEEIRKQLTDDTVVTDLQQKMVVPGFIEAHGHFPGAGLSAVGADLNSPPIGETLNIAGVLSQLRALAEDTSGGDWVFGFGFDDTMIEDKRHLTREDLDKVSTEHPIYVMHISGHLAYVNSMALRQHGITKDTPDPEGGIIGRQAGSTEPNGVLYETAQVDYRKEVFSFGKFDQLAITREAVARYLRAGVTTVQNGLARPKHAKGMRMASRVGLLPQRVIIWPEDELSDLILEGEIVPSEWESDWLTIGASKLVADGSIQGYTGFLREPYHVQPESHAHAHGESKDGKPAAYRGSPTLSPEKLLARVKQLHKAKRPLAIHANGDAAIDLVQDAWAEALKDSPPGDYRPILIHAQMMQPDQIARALQLGMTVSYFPAHIYYWGDRHHSIFMGPDRAQTISPLGSSAKAGLRFTTHLDTPIVPIDLMLLIANSVNRTTSSGEVLGPEEKISVDQALRAITIDAAWQIFQEDNRGSIEAGKFADFVVLSDDLHAIPPASLKAVKVEETWIGGVKVYPRED